MIYEKFMGIFLRSIIHRKTYDINVNIKAMKMIQNEFKLFDPNCVTDSHNDPNAANIPRDTEECKMMASQAGSPGTEAAKGVAAGGLLGDACAAFSAAAMAWKAACCSRHLDCTPAEKAAPLAARAT
jgi:hypothetical protein